jgi:hypothetical protein
MEMITTPAVSATEQAPATSHIRSEDFELGLLVSRSFTIPPFYQFATIPTDYCQKAYVEIMPKKEHYLNPSQLTGFMPTTYKMH